MTEVLIQILTYECHEYTQMCSNMTGGHNPNLPLSSVSLFFRDLTRIRSIMPARHFATISPLDAWAAHCRPIAATCVHATASLPLGKVRPLPFATLYPSRLVSARVRSELARVTSRSRSNCDGVSRATLPA